METDHHKGNVCVTGGTGYLASWLIMKLLQLGYSVNTTVRHHPGKERDLCFLTDLPGASERLRIFNADLDKPESFVPAIEGCAGVFHVAQQIDFEGEEDEETKVKRSVNGVVGILRACKESKTVRRVVYTSSSSAVQFSGRDAEAVVDESTWSDVGVIRAEAGYGSSYYLNKTVTERAALEFADDNGVDLVTVIPTFIHGPFILPRIPASVYVSLALIFGDEKKYQLLVKTPMVHVDDVAGAHIFLFEHPGAKGRYICSALELGIEEMVEFLSTRYPHYNIPTIERVKEFQGAKRTATRLSSKKLLDAGFKYRYGLEEMFDGAIECLKDKGFL